MLGTRTDDIPKVLDADEYTKAQVTPNTDTIGGPPRQPMTIINEPGLYSLILRSRKERARRSDTLNFPEGMAPQVQAVVVVNRMTAVKPSILAVERRKAPVRCQVPSGGYVLLWAS